MSRTEFPSKIRKAAWERCAGRCEWPGCGLELKVGGFQFDHILPDGLGGDTALSNCAVLCSNHHSLKTHRQDRPAMQKADNIKAKHLGLKPKRPWSVFRKKMDGTVERRST